MLKPLPITTIGDIALDGLELHVHCARCHAMRRISIDSDDRLHARNFATVRFRCRSGRANGEACGCPGAPQIRPAVLLPIGGATTLAFLYCKRCVWRIDQVKLDQPPWSTSALGPGERYRCRGLSPHARYLGVDGSARVRTVALHGPTVVKITSYNQGEGKRGMSKIADCVAEIVQICSDHDDQIALQRARERVETLPVDAP